MNQYEHHSHISITRHTREGVTRTDVHIERIGSFSGEDGDREGIDAARDGGHECFDPESCCDAQERALIAMMRAYLRPQAAPECLIERLHRTLDACCREEECGHDDVRDGDARDACEVHGAREVRDAHDVRDFHVADGVDGHVTDLQPDDVVRHADAPRPAGGTVVVRRVRVPGTEIVTVTDLSVPEGWTFPTYPEAH